MARRQKITDADLQELAAQSLSNSEIARRYGVSPSAVSQRLKALKIGVAKDVTLVKAHKFVEKKVDAIEQLQKINEYANELLDLVMRWNRGEPEALRILESQIRSIKHGDTEEEVREFKFKDPRELALKAMAEIRGQLKLQLEIFEALYDMTAIAEFQREVIETIGSVNPEAREQIIKALQEKRAIRTTLEFG